MKLRTYQAFTMAEALAAVKRDLGADAVILNTRSFVRRTMLGLRRKMIVEVTATPAEEARPQRSPAAKRAAPASARHAAAQRAYNGGNGIAAANQSKSDAGVFPVTDDDRERTRRLAMAMAAQFEAKNAQRDPAPSRLLHAEAGPALDRTRAEPMVSAQPGVDAAEPPSRRFILIDDERAKADDRSSVRSSAKSPAHHGAMDEELAAIKAMVGQVLAQQSKPGGKQSPSLPPKLLEQYLNLIAQDMSEELAEQIVSEVRDELPGGDLNNDGAVREAVARRLEAMIPCSNEPIRTASPDGRPLTIALVGPTGVGKTTTLAKLAATFKLHHGKRVGLITSDTYRIAAVDQLRTYANIIGLPLHVALTPGEMRQAVHQLSKCDVILVDTAGRSQNDELRIDELRQFIDASGAHEVHLVLSSTASEKVLLREAEAFSAVGVHKIVLTKLDEAVSFGMLVNVMRTVGKELSFVTTGQEVPNHIEPGTSQKLVSLILGGELRT